MIVLAYLWPLALVPFFLEKDDDEARWHAKNGLVLLAAESLLFVALWATVALVTLAAFGVGIFLSLCVVFVWIGVLLLHFVAMMRGLNGGRLIVPVVSDLAERF